MTVGSAETAHDKCLRWLKATIYLGSDRHYLFSAEFRSFFGAPPPADSDRLLHDVRYQRTVRIRFSMESRYTFLTLLEMKSL